MHEDDAALRAVLTQIVLTDLRAGRSSLSPPALAALRILASGPSSGPSAATDDDRARHGLRRAGAAVGVGAGIVALAGGLLLTGAGSGSPPTRTDAAPVVATPTDPSVPSVGSAPWAQPAPSVQSAQAVVSAQAPITTGHSAGTGGQPTAGASVSPGSPAVARPAAGAATVEEPAGPPPSTPSRGVPSPEAAAQQATPVQTPADISPTGPAPTLVPAAPTTSPTPTSPSATPSSSSPYPPDDARAGGRRR
jgi:hypothetical protein